MDDVRVDRNKFTAFTLIAAVVPAVLTFVYLDSFICAIVCICCVPCAMFGTYMWATGRGYKWASNGIDWRSMTESQTEACASEIGKYTVVSSILLAYGLSFIIYDFPVGMIMFAVLLAAGVIILMYPIIRFKHPENVGAARFKAMPAGKVWGVAAAAVLVLVIPAAVIADFTESSDSVDVAVGDTSLRFTAPMVDRTVGYSEISSIYLDSDFDRGSRTYGYAAGGIQSGTFKNSWGTYDLAAYTSCTPCIIIVCSDGSHCAFNQKDLPATQDLLDRIKEAAGL